ncbi:hypothetical protein [Fervidobacterium sp.]
MSIQKSIRLAVFLSVLVAIILFLALDFTLSQLNEPYGNVINFSGVKNQYIQFEKPQSLELYGSFVFDGINDTLVFQKVLATRVDIFVNEKHITTFGDGTGNLWPTALTVNIPRWILKKDAQNTLRLKIYGIVGAGIYGEYILPKHIMQRE